MKFKEMPYERPNIDEYKKVFHKNFDDFNNLDVKEQYKRILNFEKYKDDFSTNCTLVSIRHSIDTRDKFYDEENEFIDELYPLVANIDVEVAKIILSSKNLNELKILTGEQFLNLLDCSLVMKEEAIPFMQEENKLITKYDKLIASAQIEFDGKVLNLAQMKPYLESKDRDIRIDAYKKQNEFFKNHEEEFDKIYDDLVKVRNNMAKALGFKNYVDLQYKFLYRTDYNSKDVKKYRDYILKTFTPFGVELRKIQKERIGIKDFKYYDWTIDFNEGNANPIGDEGFIVENAKKMYNELSKETGEFFNLMTSMELMDLVAKPGKEAGGYCTGLDKYKVPFIFSNFNGTQGDIEVITHEAGHAFQMYMSRDYEISQYRFPTYEACEIHSMSMEFFTWPWMELFFGKGVNRFKYRHLKGAIEFLPYGATVDEFQHFVYENPDVSPEERKKKYHEIEMKYRPDLDYDDEFLNKGTFWFRQGHIFAVPFYYIDYTLAQVCAFQYLIKNLEDHKKAFSEYLTLCKAGGSQSFFKLMEIGKIKNPMIDGTLEEIITKLKEILNSIEF